MLDETEKILAKVTEEVNDTLKKEDISYPNLEALMQGSPDWTNRCAAAHFKSIPQAILQDIITNMDFNVVKALKDGSAVILEYLPYQKQVNVRSGLQLGLLDSVELSNFSRTLVVEKKQGALARIFHPNPPSLREILRA